MKQRDKLLNVLIFEPYPFGSEGGNIRTLTYILRFVDRTKYNPIVLSPFETPFTERLRAEGTECIVLNTPEGLRKYGGRSLRESLVGRLRTVRDIFVYNLRLGRLLREKSIDVAYCNSIRAVLSVAMGAKLAGVPMLWYIKGELNNPLLDTIGFALADRVLFFCESNRDDRYPALIRLYGKKVGILPIGMDLRKVEEIESSDRASLARELSIDGSRTNLVVLAQLYRPKGQHFLLEALAGLVRDHPGVRLYMVGDHVIEEYRSYKDELLRLVERYHLEDHVVFTGWRRDAAEILSLMDIAVHPSLSEGFGRAVLEAMAFGKPVVASRVGGLREIIRDGENGFLVAPGDADAIDDRLRRLLEDPELAARMGVAARATVFSGYAIEDKVEALADIWRDMAPRRTAVADEVDDAPRLASGAP